jgi:hypothetical protein
VSAYEFVFVFVGVDGHVRVCRHVFMCVGGVLCVRVFFICRSNEFPDKNGLSIKYSLKTVSQ